MRNANWGLIALVCGFAALAAASLGKILPLIGDIAAALSISQVQATWLISAIPLAAMLAAPIAGAIGDRYGDRLLLALGIGAGIAGNAVNAFATTYPGLLAGRAAEGLGFVGILTAVVAILMRLAEGRQLGAAMALFGASVPAGIGLAEALAGQLAGHDWHRVFWGHGLLLVAVLPAVRLLPPWPGRPAVATLGIQSSPWTIYRHAGPVRLSLSLAVMTLAQFGVSAMFPLYLQSTYGLALGTAALVGALGLGGSIGGNIVSFTLLGRGGDARSLAIGGMLVFSVFGVLTFITRLGAVAAIVDSVILLMSGGFINGLFLALLPRVAPDPELRGRASGLINQCNTTGVLLGPPVLVATITAGGAGAIIAAVLICTLAAFWLMPLPRVRLRPGVAD